MQIPIKCNNINVINITKNPIMHSKIKHIEVWYHLIRDHVQKGDVAFEFISTDLQLVDIFTKPLDENRICFI